VISEDTDGSYWSVVKELPGCFASGFSIEEVQEATFDAIQLWLPEGISLGDPRWSFVDKPKDSARKSAAPRRQKMLVCA